MKPHETTVASSHSTDIPEDGGRLALIPSAPVFVTNPAQETPSGHTVPAVLERYGSELRAFLSSRTSSRASMEDVYSLFAEDLWKGLPQVRAQSQLRGWLYVVARNALARHLRLKLRWRSRHVSVELDELQSEARRSLPSRMGDRVQLQEVFAQLSDEDRRLLEQRSVLRMAWRDIAAERVRDADVERESARLRKRYQILVQKLRDGLTRMRSSLVG